MSIINVDIDRIVLTGLGLSAARSKRVQDLIGRELQRLLERESLPDGMRSGEVSGISTPVLQLTGSQNDTQLANAIAQRILMAMKGPS